MTTNDIISTSIIIYAIVGCLIFSAAYISREKMNLRVLGYTIFWPLAAVILLVIALIALPKNIYRDFVKR